MNVIYDFLHVRIDIFPPGFRAEHQIFLRTPVVGNMDHIRTCVNALVCTLDDPVGVSAVQFCHFIGIHQKPSQWIFDSEGFIETFEKSGSLHIAEPTPFFAVGDGFFNTFKGLFGLRGKIVVMFQQNVGRDFAVFLSDFIQNVSFECSRSAKNVSCVKFVMIFEILYRPPFFL